MSKTIERLLDVAESGMRLRGYHAVSFRDLADELGIKSASVHYYFRQKEDLGVAVVERYAERFFASLEKHARGSKNSADRIAAFCSTYRAALAASDKICLCGVLGAEISGLPGNVGAAVRKFLDDNIKWVANALPKKLASSQRQAKAIKLVATMQGAMMLAASMGDHNILDKTVSEILAETAD